MSASGGTVIIDVPRDSNYVQEIQRTTDIMDENILKNKDLTYSSSLISSHKDTAHQTAGDKTIKTDKVMVLDKKDRRVTFADGNNIVSGYMDPPSPWNDVTSCSTEDLICAYLSSCDQFNIKPIPRLLQQLHAITNFCDRNDTLSLRGERLDGRHCETLEEILRRVQFRTIDLEATHLDEEGAIALFDMIEYYESCLRLNISYNKSIGLRGWHACSRMIKKTPCLEHLEARHCTISEQVMPMLGRSLRLGSALTIVHLENSILSGRPLLILVAAIKLNDSVRELFLADNKLMPTDGVQLGNLLKLNRSLTVLDVRNNHLQDVGVSHICEGLCEQTDGRGLHTLVMWNNQLTYQAMISVGRALSSTKCLETINLGHNNVTNEGIHRLKDGLLHNKSLMRIGLQAAKISCEGAVALAEYIAESKKLLRLDIRENDIKTGGLMAISLALKVCTNVTRVDIDKEPKRESGVRDYAEQQRRLLLDIANYTQQNCNLARELEEKQQQEEEQQKIEAAQQQTEQQEESILQEQHVEATDAFKDDDIAECQDEVCEQPPGQQQLRLHLNLPLMSRTQELESPMFVRTEDLPASSPPSLRELAANVQVVQKLFGKQPIPNSFPPSPMVSDNGRPMLAQIPQATSSLSPSIADAFSSASMSFSLASVSTLPVPSTSKVATSPTAARKFIISRVNEKHALLQTKAGQTDVSGELQSSDEEEVLSQFSVDIETNYVKDATHTETVGDCVQDHVIAKEIGMNESAEDTNSDMQVGNKHSDTVVVDGQISPNDGSEKFNSADKEALSLNGISLEITQALEETSSSSEQAVSDETAAAASAK